MKIKKNRKKRVTSKRNKFFTVAALSVLIVNPIFQGNSVLAETGFQESEQLTDVETQLPNVLRPEVPDDSKIEDDREEAEVEQVPSVEDTPDSSTSMENVISPPQHLEVTSPIPEVVNPETSTTEAEEKVITGSNLWGGVSFEWDATTGTLTLLGGTITDSNPMQLPNNILRTAIQNIEFLATVDVGGTGSLFRLFRGMSNLSAIENISYLDTNGVTSMGDMFMGTNLTEIDLSSFDTSSVTNMSGMFQGTRSLTSLDVSSFVTDRVTSMKDMFGYTHSLSVIKGLDDFNTQAVIDMAGMFWFADDLSSLDLSSFKTDNVVDMSYMFASAHSLTSLNLKSFETGNVQNMSEMFAGTWSLSNLDLSSFDTSSVTDMHYMFTGASALTTLDLSNFDTSLVRDMRMMFAHTRSLTSLNLSSFDTSSVTTMTQMFMDGSSLRSLDISNFNTVNANRNQMFSDLNALVELRLGENTIITNSALPQDTTTPGFLSSWEREVRQSDDWLTSQQLMSLSAQTNQATGTWHRVPYQTSVQVKDSQLIVGDTWQAIDNFVCATDREGNEVDFTHIQVGGDTVDTSRVGVYNVTYTFDGITETAQVTVKADQTSIQVKDSQLIVGDTWQAIDNFVGATDREGNEVDFTHIQVGGDTVDTSRVGTYNVIYTFDGITETAQVTVKADQTSIQVKDSQLTVGDTWQARDNFVAATDRHGNQVLFEEVTVTGSVDTTKAGVYNVTYVYNDAEATAQITVSAEEDEEVADSNGGDEEDTIKSEDSDIKEESTQVRTDSLPETGEISSMLGILGLTNLGFALRLWLKRRKEN